MVVVMDYELISVNIKGREGRLVGFYNLYLFY